MNKVGLYIHIPFCQSKCQYCDFTSFPGSLYKADTYIAHLKKEIDLYKEKFGKITIDTIFLGGGTPSILDEGLIFDLMNHLDKSFNLTDLSEATIEANPKTVDKDKLITYKSLGINRISLGVQTLKDELLQKIGRIHTRKDFLESYRLVRKCGFNNVNLDIMFNLPGQSKGDLLETLEEVVELEPEHISFYSLKLEEDTPFYRSYLKGELILPNEEDERQMYHRGVEYLHNNHYHHYEISNLSRVGYQCKHNLKYWRVKPYLGMGIAAHSNLNDERFNNFDNFSHYFESLDLGQLPIDTREAIDKEMEMAEYAILGLRLIEGINKKNFRERYLIDIEVIYGTIFEKLKVQGLIQEDNESIRLTKVGLDLANRVFTELLP